MASKIKNEARFGLRGPSYLLGSDFEVVTEGRFTLSDTDLVKQGVTVFVRQRWTNY